MLDNEHTTQPLIRFGLDMSSIQVFARAVNNTVPAFATSTSGVGFWEAGTDFFGSPLRFYRRIWLGAEPMWRCRSTPHLMGLQLVLTALDAV